MKKRWVELAVLFVVAALSAVYWASSNPSALPGATATSTTPQEAMQPASDPFAAVLQRGSHPALTEGLPTTPTGHDPFKAFLEKQTVSPFGMDARTSR